MRKILSRKLSSPSKLVGIFQSQKACNADPRSAQMTRDPASLIKEIQSLEEQVDGLKATLDNLKLDAENKEVKLAKLAREKEKLSMNLARVRRSNENLTQQLEDERHFYYKEKETYCQEMNEFKKIKKALSNPNVALRIDNGEEVSKLRKTLEHTLQTNYNLSVKFLRMKDTKNHLCKTLDQVEEEHHRVVADLKTKIDILTSELKEILNQKFEVPLSPSNRKYLQLVNHNSSLVYENLYLQMQLDRLNFQLKRDMIHRTKSQETAREKHRKVRSPHTIGEDSKVIKIFEREKRASLPTVTILNEKEVLKRNSSDRKLQLPVVNESKLEVFQVSGLTSRSSVSDVTSGGRKRSRSAPKIVQSGSFNQSTIDCNKEFA